MGAYNTKLESEDVILNGMLESLAHKLQQSWRNELDIAVQSCKREVADLESRCAGVPKGDGPVLCRAEQLWSSNTTSYPSSKVSELSELNKQVEQELLRLRAEVGELAYVVDHLQHTQPSLSLWQRVCDAQMCSSTSH